MWSYKLISDEFNISNADIGDLGFRAIGGLRGYIVNLLNKFSL